MPQGYIRIDEVILKEIASEPIDFAALKEKLLLPEHYEVNDLRRVPSSVVGTPYADILVSASEIPEGAEVTPIYQRTYEPDAEPYYAGSKTSLLRIEIKEQQ